MNSQSQEYEWEQDIQDVMSQEPLEDDFKNRRA